MASDPNQPLSPSESNPLLKSKTFLAVTVLACLQTVYESGQGLYWMMTTEEKLSSSARLFGVIGTSVPLMLSLAGFILMVKGATGILDLPRSPSGKVFDFLMPPEDAEYRALAMEIAFENWRARYSLPVTWLLYSIHSISTVALYYVDRIKRGK